MQYSPIKRPKVILSPCKTRIHYGEKSFCQSFYPKIVLKPLPKFTDDNDKTFLEINMMIKRPRR